MPRHPFISLIALLPALLLWQAPEFMQQYYQRLSGAVDELARIVQHFDEDARRSGYDRTGALKLMATNPERLVRDQAVRMEDNVARLDRLRAQQEALRSAGPFGRFVSFVVNFDAPLAAKTFASYVPALSITIEGILSAALGFFVAYFAMVAGVAAWRRRRIPLGRGAASR